MAHDPLANWSWHVPMRWITVAVQLGTVALVWLFPNLDAPLRSLTPLILASALMNAVSAGWLARPKTLPRAIRAVSFAADVVLLTGLLDVTGGPYNPFIVIYAVYIGLAAATMGIGWAWTMAAFSAAAYGVLVYLHLQPDEGEVHHRLTDFPTHLFTMWTAAVGTTELIAFYVRRASLALADRQRQLDDMRERAARSERLAALTTLAAGAAHELSTPLATIAVATRELEHAIGRIDQSHALLEDARLIRTEVGRCRTILDQMSGRAGGIAPDEPERLHLAEAITAVLKRLPADRADRLRVTMPEPIDPIVLPRTGLIQAITSLVKNAFDASPVSSPVHLRVSRHDGVLRVIVQDEGSGMSAEALARAGEPFYTTKEPGYGFGLGVFLARVFTERVGGTLTFESDRGTRVTLDLPANREESV
ncbi:MAG TPA: ATP-binding protein [Vicinamibacterales bacterium]|jgi:two-component system sensor histidine kinase RegB